MYQAPSSISDIDPPPIIINIDTTECHVDIGNIYTKAIEAYHKAEYETVTELCDVILKNSLEENHNPSSYYAFMLIAACLACQKDYESALKYYHKSIRYLPIRAEAYYGMGLCYTHLSQYTQAIHCYKKAINHNPTHHSAWHNLGVLYSIVNQDFKESVICWEKAIEIKNDKYKTLHNLGFACYQNKDYYKALEYFKKVLQINPYFNYAQFNLIQTLIFLQKYETAIQQLNLLLENNPRDISFWSLLVQIYIRTKKYDLAVGLLEKYKPYHVQEFLFNVFTAELHIHLGKYHEALKLLEDLLPIVKKSSHLCSHIAFCYAQIGQPKQSIIFLENALAVAEEEKRASHQTTQQLLLLPATPSLIYYNLGVNYGTLKKMAEAMQAYQQALLLQPNSVLAMTGMISILLQSKNKYDEVYDLAKTAIKYDENNLYLQLLLGVCYIQKGNYEKGMSYLAAAPQKDLRFKISRMYYYYKAAIFNSTVKSFSKIKNLIRKLS